jgi:hypothetical protein
MKYGGNKIYKKSLTKLHLVELLSPSNSINLITGAFKEFKPFGKLAPPLHQSWILIQHLSQLLSLKIT